MFIHWKNKTHFWFFHINENNEWVHFDCECGTSFAHFLSDVGWTDSQIVFVGKHRNANNEGKLQQIREKVHFHCEHFIWNTINFFSAVVFESAKDSWGIRRYSECDWRNEFRLFKHSLLLKDSFAFSSHHRISMLCNCFPCVDFCDHRNCIERLFWFVIDVRCAILLPHILMDEHSFCHYVLFCVTSEILFRLQLWTIYPVKRNKSDWENAVHFTIRNEWFVFGEQFQFPFCFVFAFDGQPPRFLCSLQNQKKGKL